MMTAEDFVLELKDDEEKRNFKLGIVVELFENDTAKIKFDGEETDSEKQYAYLSSYIPVVDDRVLLAVTGGTYIILGKVNYNVSPESGEEQVDRYLFDLKTVNILKGLELSGDFNANDGMSVVGNIGVNGNVMATGLSATGAVTGASATINGSLSSGSLDTGTTNVSYLTATGTVKGNYIDSTNAAYLRGDLRHSGSYVGFYGKTPTNRKRVDRYIPQPTGSDPDSKIMLSRLNALIKSLQDYGLIDGY